MTTQDQALGSLLWKFTDWIMANKGKNCLQLATRENLFRYVALCWLTGRLNVSTDDQNRITAVVFSWTDWREHIELKAAEGRQQFESHTHKGDAIFVAEVIGSRSGVSRIYQGAIERFPHLSVTPIFTYRKNKLVQLTWNEIERFMGGKFKC